ncbi:HoxN/HupN/NixA family nickel/cobalt transporter [Aneurinibacillus terranovensis]|uniref:HoxN/HupN/NixA family nickel/cobalt transporter n=1 Tax=Aneurinibacillus terranovensis TaxID=278991 RepID=UPI0004068D67|nr:HoxN/HupN/NixA family nickel/cobalt transporter [Aneurinibacillus terranovensis]
MGTKSVDRRYGTVKFFFVVGFLHLIGITGILSVRHGHPLFLGMAFLAYTLGLRHAFDIDHIAAIDNTVRKLVQQNRNPAGVGFFFSLGHSTVVFLLAVCTAFSVQWVHDKLPYLKEVGGIIGTLVSGIFLLLIGLVNLIILKNISQAFLKMRRKKYGEEEFDSLLLSRGFLSRFIRPLYAFINQSWHVYPLGFLFGLGFDTASEVALLAMSAGAVKNALPLSGILALPILFAAGMSLLDTADGVFMTTSYRWALNNPVRKIYYNLTVTAISVLSALLIGLVELAQIVVPQLGLTGGFWLYIQDLNLGALGYILVALFVCVWGVSYCVWKWFRIEERWGQ